jgi:hypothetical protein
MQQAGEGRAVVQCSRMGREGGLRMEAECVMHLLLRPTSDCASHQCPRSAVIPDTRLPSILLCQALASCAQRPASLEDSYHCNSTPYTPSCQQNNTPGVMCALQDFPLFFTAGVHPHNAKDCTDSALQDLRQLAAHERCVAIGG